MTTPTLWTTADFDAMNWHDAHVHALRVVQDTHGSGELILDIDYILEWRTGEALYSFVVVQATLQFHEVHNLVMNLDYATPQAGFGAFSIDGITRESFTDARGLPLSGGGCRCIGRTVVVQFEILIDQGES